MMVFLYAIQCTCIQDGEVTRRWEWPPHKLNLSQSISIHVRTFSTMEDYCLSSSFHPPIPGPLSFSLTLMHTLILIFITSLQLNAQVSVRGTNLTNFVLRVSCRGQNYKFAVGPSMENLDENRLVSLSLPIHTFPTCNISISLCYSLTSVKASSSLVHHLSQSQLW